MWKKYRQVYFNADGGAGGGADAGAAGDQGGQQGSGDSLGWRAGLPVEYRDHEHVKGFTKVGDFVKSAIDLKTEHTGLQGKLANAIIKPGENATSEERSAYLKSLGVPESPDGYEFPAVEGIQQNEQMTAWARGVFHKHGIPKEAAAGISQEWDRFMLEMDKAHQEAVQNGMKEADTQLRDEWKGDYDKNIEVTKRGFQAFEKVVPGFAEFLDQTTPAGVKIGNDPRMLKVFNAIGKAIGDDLSFPGATPPGQQQQVGDLRSIYKVPNPPKVD